MEGDIPEETVMLRSDLGVVLSGLPLFAGLEAPVLRQIAESAEWLSLPGGSTLFAAGEASDALYVVLSGCLGVFSPDSRDRRRFMGRVLAGDTVGEMGLITGQPRTATIEAEVNSVLYELSATAYESIKTDDPALSAALFTYVIKVMAERLSFASRVIGVLKR